ncbi:MAG: EF-hand domain-containing protein [Gammaproteobacteria bacterium]|nr:EF-hand domain-containing protein [Gammaproteobacteria bacterium]
MKKLKTLAMSALVSTLAFSAGYALAVDQAPATEQAQTQQQEQIYGSQLMTPQERAEQRAKMRAAKTADEQEQIRKEHHERMKVRAKERGVTLPDEPLTRGDGMGAGRGMGMGGGNARQNAMPSFSDFDLNNDGKITEEEFIEARTARISDRAQQGYQMRGLTDAASFADIDTNGDGSISPEEFSAYQSVHRQQMGR